MRTEKDIENELDGMLDEVKKLREENMTGKEQPLGYKPMHSLNQPVNVEKVVKQLKNKQSITFKTKIQINKKKYSIRQNNWFYGYEYETEPTKENLKEYWYLTNATMRAIIKNHRDNFMVKLKSYFDGMIDGTHYTEADDYHKPSDETVRKIISDLGRTKLMSCHYYPEQGRFTCYSCCDSWEFTLTGVNIKFI
jgi:hypothetical protein